MASPPGGHPSVLKVQGNYRSAGGEGRTGDSEVTGQTSVASVLLTQNWREGKVWAGCGVCGVQEGPAASLPLLFSPHLLRGATGEKWRELGGQGSKAACAKWWRV